MPVTVRYFAGARAAAGVPEEVLSADAYTISGLVDELSARHGPQLAKVLAVASFLVDGVTWHDRETVLPAGCTVDILPPFAGG